MIPNNKMIKIK